MKYFPALAVLGVLAFSGCGKKPTPVENPQAPTPAVAAAPTATPEPAPVEDPLATRIGFLAPLNGAQTSFGQDAIRGAQLAVDEINTAGGVLGHPIALRVKDTISLPEKTEAATTDLIDTGKVAAIIGEIATDRSLIAAPVAQQRGVPMVTPGSTSERITQTGDFIFRVCYTDTFQASVMAKFANSMKAEKAAILYDPSNAYSSGLAEIFKKDYTAAGGQIVAEETYRAGDMGFARQVNAIRAKGPEIVFLPSYYGDAAPIIREARQAGLDVPFLGTDGWDSPEFLKVGGAAADNCYFSSHFSAENKAPNVALFVEKFTQRFGAPPPPLAALSYDAVQLVADGLKRAGSAEGPALRDALAATKDLPGVTGNITLDANRNPSKSAVITRVENGQFTYLETVAP